MSVAIKTATGPSILLASGHYFDLLDPWNSRFDINDIAHGLSNTCRFAGQCSTFYSVAEHSLHVSRLLPRDLRFAGLMRDAAEAFIGDVTRPLKSLLPQYKAIEKNIEAAIFARFGLADIMNDPAAIEEIKQADLRMLAAEQLILLPPHDDEWHCIAGLAIPQISLKCWPPSEARERFLTAWREGRS